MVSDHQNDFNFQGYGLTWYGAQLSSSHEASRYQHWTMVPSCHSPPQLHSTRSPGVRDNSVSSCRSYIRVKGSGTRAGAFPTHPIALSLSGEGPRGSHRTPRLSSPGQSPLSKRSSSVSLCELLYDISDFPIYVRPLSRSRQPAVVRQRIKK